MLNLAAKMNAFKIVYVNDSIYMYTTHGKIIFYIVHFVMYTLHMYIGHCWKCLAISVTFAITLGVGKLFSADMKLTDSGYLPF